MRIASRTALWCSGLALLLIVVGLASATIGPVSIPITTVAKATLNALAVPSGVGVSVTDPAVPLLGSIPVPVFDVTYARLFSFRVPGQAQFIVGRLRLPRIALGATVGFALASAGAVMQGFFRNPMADPSIIGVSSGASVGAVAAIAFPALVPLGLRPAAFAGAILAAFGVYAIAAERGRTPVATLLLAGVAVQTFLGAITSYLLVMSGDSLREAMYWLMGTLHNATWSEVELALPPALLTFAVLLLFARDLNVLLLGEEDAHALGVSVERTKRLLLALASLVTAAAVAVSGVIGFVGLIVPHAMRLVVGPDHRILLPTSALAGASFLIVADTIARSGAAELPVGIVTAFVGAPFFLYLLRNREVHAL